MGTFHIIGAGLSGLAAAMQLAQHGNRICLYESGGHAGGRCRSYHDHVLDREIDNGNHLLVGANKAVWDYATLLDTTDTLINPQNRYPFVNVKNDKTWQVKPPFYVEGLPLIEYLDLIRLLMAGKTKTVTEVVAPLSGLYCRYLLPLCLALLNTDPDKASAQLLGRTLWHLTAQKDGMKPFVPAQSWQESLITPAVNKLQAAGHSIYYQHALKSIQTRDDEAYELVFSRTHVTVSSSDCIILATPANITAQLLDELEVPTSFNPIVNAHFAYDHGEKDGSLVGVVDGITHWLFFKEGIISTTTSAAHSIADSTQEDLAKTIWKEISHIMAISAELPDYRIITEKRATFSATPDNLTRRPPNRTSLKNLFLAGDYTNTGLPACMESAIVSGNQAAALAISYLTH